MRISMLECGGCAVHSHLPYNNPQFQPAIEHGWEWATPCQFITCVQIFADSGTPIRALCFCGKSARFWRSLTIFCFCQRSEEDGPWPRALMRMTGGWNGNSNDSKVCMYIYSLAPILKKSGLLNARSLYVAAFTKPWTTLNLMECQASDRKAPNENTRIWFTSQELCAHTQCAT
jgi:hypothetical protein